MKRIYMTAALLITTISVATGVCAQNSLIAPPEGLISIIKTGSGADNYAVTVPESSDEIAITKKGSLLLVGGTSLAETTVSSDDGTVTFDILKALSADFDENENDKIKAKNIEKNADGNSYAVATSGDNIIIDMSEYNVASGEVTLAFDVLLEKASKTNLFTLCDENGKNIFDVQLRFRNDENVYVAYQRDKYNYTALRTKLLPVGEWLHIEALINLDNNTVTLYCGSDEIFGEQYMITDEALSSFKIGASADNISVYSGRKLTSAETKINTTTLSLTDEYDFVSQKLSAAIKIFDEYEEIEPKYLYWEADDNNFCKVSSDGVLTADIRNLSQPGTVNVCSVFSCSEENVSVQKQITVSADGNDGQVPSSGENSVIAYLSKTKGINAGDKISVTAVVYNGANTAQTYYVVVPLYDADGKNVQNHVFKVESVPFSGRVSNSYEIDVASGNSLSARIFMFDKDFSINVLK